MTHIERFTDLHELGIVEEANVPRLNILLESCFQARIGSQIREEIIVFGGAITGKDISLYTDDKKRPDIDLYINTDVFTKEKAKKYLTFGTIFIDLINKSGLYKNNVSKEQLHNFLDRSMINPGLNMFRYGHYFSIGDEIKIIRR
ncbi:hypothetical protein KKD37_02845 [Patescibacteria group bacterium]|nr:hypothetical protein [Patescibacteria group bacterium]